MSRHFIVSNLAIFGLSATFLVGSMHAEILADFSDGDGASSSDQYPGTAGDGWETAWSVGAGGSLSFNATTTDNTPLDSSDPTYLAYSGGVIEGTGATSSNADTNLQRAYTPLDPTDSTTVTLRYRIDDDGGSFFRIHGTNGESVSGASTSANDAWVVFGTVGSTWKAQDYSGGSGNNVTVGSGLSVQAGKIYEITVNENNTDKTYDVSIRNITDDTTPVTASDLGYRTATYDDPYVRFTTRVNNGSPESTTFGYSVDSIRIVPEPGSAALCILGGILILFRQPRKDVN